MNSESSDAPSFVKRVLLKVGKTINEDVESKHISPDGYLRKVTNSICSFSASSSNVGKSQQVKNMGINMGYVVNEEPEKNHLANGHSGGLLSIWDPSSFIKDNVFVFDRYIMVKGVWVSTNLNCFMVNIYAPQQEADKTILWENILQFMKLSIGNYLFCGDFNSARCKEDRMGLVYNKVNAHNFNKLLDEGHFIDLPLGRHKFTRANIDGLKASRIDRVLVNHSFFNSVKDLTLEVLDDILSDHRPLLINQKSNNSWLLSEDLDSIVNNSWNKTTGNNNRSALGGFKDKLKTLKNDIKDWRKKNHAVRNRDDITKKIAQIDHQISSIGDDSELFIERRRLINELNMLDHRNNCDLKQKAKIKWSMEGDKNSKFFHAVINKKKRQSGFIRGVKDNGRWVCNPPDIKQCFRDHFSKKFSSFAGIQFQVDESIFKSLSKSQVATIESDFIHEEFRSTVWSCGGDKAPGPDGFSFAFGMYSVWSTSSSRTPRSRWAAIRPSSH
uniref:uncharacterized protein LOC122601193 n=1 Tax=Erigeron canadensis TaxID=72917 RepID=UPI001CB91717|nr:uncharacterized protein LOC122601193 [Erigeron canadensis]